MQRVKRGVIDECIENFVSSHAELVVGFGAKKIVSFLDRFIGVIQRAIRFRHIQKLCYALLELR